VHLHGVDTLLVQGLDSEEFLETIWVLSDGLHSGECPAVAERALVDLIKVDAFGTPEGVSVFWLEHVGHAHPPVVAEGVHSLRLIVVLIQELVWRFKDLSDIRLGSLKTLLRLFALKLTADRGIDLSVCLIGSELERFLDLKGIHGVSLGYLTEEGPGGSYNCELNHSKVKLLFKALNYMLA